MRPAGAFMCGTYSDMDALVSAFPCLKAAESSCGGHPYLSAAHDLRPVAGVLFDAQVDGVVLRAARGDGCDDPVRHAVHHWRELQAARDLRHDPEVAARHHHARLSTGWLADGMTKFAVCLRAH